jgi:hypothetical protein
MPSSRENKHKKKELPQHCHESSDSSNSSSQLECFSNEKEHKKCKKHNKHETDSDSTSDSEPYTKSESDHCKKHNTKHCKKHGKNNTDSESEHKPKFKLCDVYNYFKNRLIDDEQLMIAGSSAYCHTTSTLSENLTTNHSVKLNNDVIMYNIDRFSDYSPFFVRESGIYIFFVCINTDSSAQFTFFINDVVAPLTCVGTNSGAGQVISRHMLKLSKGDNIVIRNYISSSLSVACNVNVGGLQLGNSTVVIGFKIAPLYAANVCVHNEVKFINSLTHKKKKLFKKLSEIVLCDKTLMPKGFNVRGIFYNNLLQSVLTEAEVVFNDTSVVEGLYWNPLNPSQVKILDDGFYKLFFLVNTATAGQFTIAVDGIPIDSTTQGTNRGAGQLSLRTIIELKQNQIITVVNHTSSNGIINISEHAGGKYQSINSILTVFKLAPSVKAQPVVVNCNLAKHYERYYLLFRDYLLYNKCLQINGSNTFLSTSATVIQDVPIGDSIHWENKVMCKNIDFEQGDNFITIKKEGIYDLFVDVITDEPLQITLFINNVPDYNTTFGRDSGASRTLIRSFLHLKVGDMVSIRNWESHAGSVHTSQNAGGVYPGQSSMFLLFLLTPNCS